MKLNLNKINNNKWYYLLLLYALILPFGSALPNIFLGVLCFFWLLGIVKKDLDFSKRNLKWAAILSGYYFFYLTSILYSENIEYAIKKVALQSILLLLPLVILTIKHHLNSRKVFNLLQGSILSTVVFSALSLLFALKNSYVSGSKTIGSLMEKNLSEAFVDLHYLEFSLLVTVTICLVVYLKLFKKKYVNRFINKWAISITLFLIGILVLLNSISSIAVTFTMLFIQLFIFYKKKKQPLPIVLMVFVGCTLFLSNYHFNTKFREKVKEIIAQDKSYDVNNYWGGRGMRILIWNSSMKVVKNNPVFGVGVGDQNDELTLIYRKYRIGQLLYNNKNFNAHNIFLQSLICAGIIGLALFLLSLILPIMFALKYHNIIYIVFISIFILSGISESFLQVNFGVVFFSFFNSLLFILCFKNEHITNT